MEEVIPLFKSHYSMGRSILTLESPELDDTVKGELKLSTSPKKRKLYPNGPASIFDILIENGMKSLVLVEDNPYSFFDAYKTCSDLKINLIYGIKFNIKDNPSEKSDDSSLHKFIVFLSNKDSYSDVNKIYTIHNKFDSISLAELKSVWTDNLLGAVPFYDSFLHKNHLQFGLCVPDFSFCKPFFFLEDNGLPFDSIIANNVKRFCDGKYEIFKTKTICYYKRADIDAYMAYRCICDRGFGKQKTVNAPNMDHFCSDEFCFESWKELNNG